MSDPVEVLLNSPRSVQAMERLGLTKDELTFLKKEEFKAKLGNMKISKQELDQRWNDYEYTRREKISQILEVSSQDQFSHQYR